MQLKDEDDYSLMAHFKELYKDRPVSFVLINLNNNESFPLRRIILEEVRTILDNYFIETEGNSLLKIIDLERVIIFNRTKN